MGKSDILEVVPDKDLGFKVGDYKLSMFIRTRQKIKSTVPDLNIGLESEKPSKLPDVPPMSAEQLAQMKERVDNCLRIVGKNIKKDGKNGLESLINSVNQTDFVKSRLKKYFAAPKIKKTAKELED